MNDMAPMGDPRDVEPEIPDALPVNYEAEQALLGAILAENRAFDRVSDKLRPEHFADPSHGRIYEACGKLIEGGQTANAVTLKGHFERDQGLEQVGGAVYLAKLQSSYVTIINAADYGETILAAWLRRQIIDIGGYFSEMAHQGGGGTEDVIKLLEEMTGELSDIGEIGIGEGPGRALPELMGAVISNVEAAVKGGGPLGIPTGLLVMDDVLGGLHPSDLVILAGRPSMGKTSLALTIAVNAARAGKRVLFDTIEMSAEQLTARVLASATGISVHDQRRGKVDQAGFDALMDAQRELHGLPLEIVEPRHPTVQACRAKARSMKRRGGLDLIVIDYLQLMRAPEYAENRLQEVSGITRDLKKLAKDLDVPVLALSQLSRKVEEREDKRPMLSDLRESGTIEQDADVVVFIYREVEYVRKAEPRKKDRETADALEGRVNDWRDDMARLRHLAEVLVAKQRHGPVAELKVHYDPARTRFSNLAENIQTNLPLEEGIF